MTCPRFYPCNFGPSGWMVGPDANAPRTGPYGPSMTRTLGALRVVRALRFLFVGPLVLLVLCVVNAMTYHGEWWVRWAALGIGIAWVVSLFRVLRAAILLGGAAALVAWLLGRRPQSH